MLVCFSLDEEHKSTSHSFSCPHLLPHIDASAVQQVDVLLAFVHESTDESVVTEDDAGHLGDILVTLVLADVATVIHQARYKVAPPSFFVVALLYLQVHWGGGVKQSHQGETIKGSEEGRPTSAMVLLQTSKATDSNLGSVVRLSL